MNEHTEGIGFVEAIKFHEDDLLVAGWAANKNPAFNLSDIVVCIDGKTLQGAVERFPREDVAEVYGIPVNSYGFIVKIRGRDLIGAPYQRKLGVFARHGDACWQLVQSIEGSEFDFLSFETGEEFSRNFQNPAFRVKNNTLLSLGALRALEIFQNDVNLNAAAYCILLYRLEHVPGLLQNLSIPQRASNFFDKFSDDGSGYFVRWKISLATALAFESLSRNDLVAADSFFDALLSINDAVCRWPQMTFSILCAMLFRSWLKERMGNRAIALKLIENYRDIFEAGLSHVKHENWFIFEEMHNAVNAAQQCAVLLAKLKDLKAQDFAMPDNVDDVQFSKLSPDWAHYMHIFSKTVSRPALPENC
ncbi:hypothetical protein [uncultured Pseudacidovorax sp.]|uniref:hypothetical protein n=1 Tax=uncultured Pseudacidovorax sp. TaxID=679313 RepID=UPI0025DA6F51|nr:hypothetical protein [uncultured Pseudacidovorax sp.]